MKKIKQILPLLALLSVNNNCFAHEQSGSLGTLASATDYYQITCDTGTNYLEFSVSDDKPIAAPLVSAQISKAYNILSTTDKTDADGKLSAPELIAQWGAGSYLVMVNKNKSGVENYTFTAHCMSNDNVHMDETISILQNQ